MTRMVQTTPDEEVPLLGDQQVLTSGKITGCESKTAKLVGPQHTSGANGRIGGYSSDVVERTPLPWAQLSITLLVLLGGLLTINVISPVSSLVGFSYRLPFASFYVSRGFDWALNATFFSPP